MRVKFVCGPRAGEIVHAPHSQEIQIMAACGFVEILPELKRGTNEYLAERGALSPAPSIPVEWGVTGDSYRQTAVVKKRGSETTYYDSPPADCPASVAARFHEMKRDPEAAAAVLDEARRNQATYDERIKTAKRW